MGKAHVPHLILTLVIFTTLVGCSSDGGDDDNGSRKGETFIVYDITGPIINGDFLISASNEKEVYASTHIVGLIGNVQSTEGEIRMVGLGYRGFGTADNVRQVQLNLPAEKKQMALGTQVSGPVYASNGEAIFDIEFAFFQSEYTLYDPNGDGSSDLTSGILMSESVTVTITDYVEAEGDFGIASLIHMKGSFQGTGYFLAVQTGTPELEKVAHTIKGEFEFHRDR